MKSLLIGIGGKIGSKVYRIDGFIERSREKFGDRFDYSKTLYKNAKAPLIITCKEHGDLETTADLHLKSAWGCKKCSFVMKKKQLNRKGKAPMDKVTLMNRLLKKFPGKEFTVISPGLSNGVVEYQCITHNRYIKDSPLKFLLRKSPCTDCSLENFSKKTTASYDYVIQQFINAYGDKYEYPESNREHYRNKKSILTIFCSKHGEFKKRAQKHLSGQGCPDCRMEQAIADGKFSGSYSDDYFALRGNIDLQGWVYYVKIGDLFKIGITQNIKRRLRSLRSKAKKEVTLISSVYGNLYQAYKTEQFILEDYSQHRVYTKFSTELFNIDILKGSELKDIFNQTDIDSIRANVTKEVNKSLGQENK